MVIGRYCSLTDRLLGKRFIFARAWLGFGELLWNVRNHEPQHCRTHQYLEHNSKMQSFGSGKKQMQPAWDRFQDMEDAYLLGKETAFVNQGEE